MSFYKELLWAFSPSTFIQVVCDEGIFVCLLMYFFVIFLILLISPILILGFPFVYINTKSKKWFKGD